MNGGFGIAGLSNTYSDDEGGTIAVRGHPEEIELLEWFLAEFSNPAGDASQIVSRQFPSQLPGQPGPPPPTSNHALAQPDEIVRIIFLPKRGDVQSLSSLWAAVHRVSDVRLGSYVFEVPADPGRYAVYFRGGAKSSDAAEWLIRDLLGDGNANHERAMDDGTVLHTFPVPEATSSQQSDRLAEQLKVVTGAEVYSIGAFPSLVMRGASAQVDAAEQALSELVK